MGNALVSIVVPIYNAEHYLDRCMESLINQTYHQIEIILVDDRSKDKSLAKCCEWADKDDRVTVVAKDINEGAGLARNTGMKAANGRYILFVDSDDYLALDTIEKSIAVATRYDAQAVVFGYSDVDCYGEVKRSYLTRKELTVYEGAQIQEKFIPDLIAPNPEDKKASEPPHARALMFEMQPLQHNGWKFVSERDIVSEDVYSLTEVFGLLNKIAIIPDVLYFYCENENSITHSYNKEYYGKIQPFYLEMIKLCDNRGYQQTIRKRVAAISLSYVIAAMKKEMTAITGVKVQLKRTKEIVNDNWVQKLLTIVKYDKNNRNRNILFYAMRYKLCFVCWCLIRGKIAQANINR